MYISVKKTVSILLALILCLSPVLSLGAAAVSFPEGVSRTDVQAVMPKLEKLADSLMESESIDLSAMIYDMLFADSLINSMIKTLYVSEETQETAQTLSTLGVDFSPANVANGLEKYPEISAALAACATWDDAKAVIDTFKWNITSPEQFGEALSGIFYPFNDLLFTLLCSGKYSVNVLLSIKGENGYSNSIVPLLKTVGCPDIMTQEAFTAAATEDRSSMIKNLVKMLFSSVDNMLASPISGMCKYLPAIAYLLYSEALTETITTLISPLSIRVGIISFTGLDAMMENLSLMENSQGLTSMLQDMDMSSLLGEDVQFDFPEIDLKELSQCGSVNQNGIFVADEELAFIWLLEFIVELLKLNSSEILSMLSGEMSVAGDMSAMLNTFLSKDTSSLVKLVFDIFTLESTETINNYQWTYAPVTPVEITYTANLTKDDYAKMLGEIDEVLNQFAYEFGGGTTLSQLLETELYSNTLVSTLVKSIYSMLADDSVSGILSLLGVDATPAGVAAAVESQYPAAAEKLSKLSSWDKLNEKTFTWGFSNGSKSGFTNVLTAVLRPFFPMLRLLLAGGSMNILDVIDIYGSNGYNTAVIPLLEALGCDSSLIKPYAQYAAGASTDSVLTDILTPVTALIDRLIASPVSTIVEILPNLMYFADMGGISICIDNLIFPVKVLLEKLGMSDLLSSSGLNTQQLDIKSLLSSIDMGEIGISLENVDLSQVKNLGTAVTKTSKATLNGAYMQYTYVQSDSPAVLVSLLRTLLGAMDPSAMSSFMSGDMMNENPMFATYAQNITEQLSAMTTDETIEWFYDLLFAETPTVELPDSNEEEFIPTVIYTPEKTTDPSTVIVIVAVIVVVLIVGIIVLVAKLDVSEIKQKKKRKKELKALKKLEDKKEAERLNPAKARKAAEKAAKEKDKNENAKQEKAKTEKPKKTEVKKSVTNTAKFPEELPEKELTAEEKAKQLIKDKKLSEKEFKKLESRTDKAANKAIKAAKKADKYYEKAVKEANNKKK